MPLRSYVGCGLPPLNVQTAEITLTDAQIKTLRTVPVQLTNAPGPGKFIFPIAAVAVINIASAYGNVSTADFMVGVSPFGLDTRLMGLLDQGVSLAFTFVGRNILNFPTADYGVTGAESRAWFPALATTMENKPAFLYMVGGSGDLTLGSPSNFLRFKFYYTLEDY